MASGTPDYSPRVISSAENDAQLKISVTDSDSSASFPQKVRSILIYNDGPNPVHYKRNVIAVITNFKIPAKSGISTDVPITTPHFICDSGETATVYVLGVY